MKNKDQDQLYSALYHLNLTQLAIGSALEDLTALIEQISCLESPMSTSLRRQLSTIERNSDRSCEAIYSLISSRQKPEALWSPHTHTR
ncbi:hypothetical protein [Pseudomonas sp. 6D_7.1_Bac1]|uniref:hypothetical protein n=1 Tax=Pseudomonas sp. 6D_7.1_Bac1 TaxID=2971615 RepID=UPI0021CA9FB2|nr:hypothetical protein [Pseudomonas sp. 6D_7.1_Bac1]MCU1750204.1 hypothetical protein [Pseudomonas sp. 6D_7.1_Bac1]